MSIQKALTESNFKKLISIYQTEETIILLSNKNIYTKSNAILNTFKLLGGGFKLMGLLYVFPKSLRDYFYDFIAKNRYRLFGKREQCHLPKAKFTDRFL